MNLRRTLPFLLLLGLAVGQTELLAGNFRVSPVQLYLKQGEASALVTIFNDADQPVRFQISASAWSQSEKGEIQLSPTEDILFFPKLLEIAPGSQKSVRVASTSKAGALEKTYRLFFDELPPAPVPGQGATVNVITKMGVPIFITPSGAAARIELDGAVAGSTLNVTVRNSGASHATLQEVRVRGVDAAGRELFSERKDAWYLLAESIRRFEFSLGERCGAISELIIESVYVTPASPEPQRSTTTLRPGEGACAE